jgi:putative DNA primase/helicase
VTEPLNLADVNAAVAPAAARTVELTGDDNRDTDRANAAEFAARVRDRMVYVPAQGWRYFDERRWVDDVDQIQAIQQLGRLADELWLRARQQDDEDRNRTRARAKRLESSGGISGTLRFAAADPELVREVSAFDTNPWLLNCPNGTFDLRTLQQVERTPGHYITRLCPTPLDPQAPDDEVWTKAVTEALGGDPDKLRFYRRWWGYCLTGDVRMKMFLVMVGVTDAAKSTISEPFLKVLGDVEDGGYASVWDVEMVQAGAKINRAEKMDKVRAARVIFIGELEKGTRFADGFVKRYTGGNTMDAKALYKGSYSYRPQGKLLLDTNYVPKSADPAVHNRLAMMYLDHVPERIDRSIKSHLEDDPAAHRAMLRWAAEGCRDWWDDGTDKRSFGETPWLAEVKSRYVRASDALVQFVDECFDGCPESPLESAPTQLVWAVYSAWATEFVGKPLPRRTFDSAMEERGHARERWPKKGGRVCFTGIKLKSRDELPECVRAPLLAGMFGHVPV